MQNVVEVKQTVENATNNAHQCGTLGTRDQVTQDKTQTVQLRQGHISSAARSTTTAVAVAGEATDCYGTINRNNMRREHATENVSVARSRTFRQRRVFLTSRKAAQVSGVVGGTARAR